jgi:hypothetical protein
VCDAGAINLEEMQEMPDAVPVVEYTCEACGVAVHEPEASAGGGGLCQVCRKTGHHKKLFQVLT